jgi:O-acetyl-ADP-ribose deacetylase (regulator of RNase III)
MIQYVVGDATRPELTPYRGFSRAHLIVHIVNDVGAWGKGFVLALAREYPLAKTSYRYWYEHRSDGQRPRLVDTRASDARTETYDPEFKLGSVKFVRVSSDVEADGIEVAHMIAQHGIGTISPPIRYDALEKCLSAAAEYARDHEMLVHMPRIGCGLAGGSWDRVEQIVEKTMGDLSVTVYDLPGR